MLIFFVFFALSLKTYQTQDINDELDKHRSLESFVELKGGDFLTGINDRAGVNYENPTKNAHVEPFRILMYPVTNAAFRKFKNHKHKFRTDAEKSGFSWVFKSLKNQNAKIETNKNIDDLESQEALKSNMLPVREARWNKPEGGSSSIRDKLDYPVVHVSYNDAFAFCAWKGMRLPTEIEWEYAARGGLHNKPYPWGERWQIGRTNLWQGKFPEENQLRDGHYGLAPVNALEPQNSFEMYDVLGNTWEWTSTVFRNPYTIKDEITKRRIAKGGSFLDTRDPRSVTDKMRIRISARMGLVEHYTAQNLGFRCAQSIKKNEMKKFGDKNFRIVRLRPPKTFKLPGTHEEL